MNKRQKFPHNLDTKEKKEKFLKKIKVCFYVPLFIFLFSLILIIGIPVSEDSNFNYVSGSFYLIGSLSIQFFLFGFWIMNLIVMWRLKKWAYFVFAIPLPFIAIIFYFMKFYPFLEGEKDKE